MTAALSTLAFLATMWMLVIVGAWVLEQSGSKIAAALKGRSAAPTLTTTPMRLRHRERGRKAIHATPRLSAAA